MVSKTVVSSWHEIKYAPQQSRMLRGLLVMGLHDMVKILRIRLKQQKSMLLAINTRIMNGFSTSS